MRGTREQISRRLNDRHRLVDWPGPYRTSSQAQRKSQAAICSHQALGSNDVQDPRQMSARTESAISAAIFEIVLAKKCIAHPSAQYASTGKDSLRKQIAAHDRHNRTRRRRHFAPIARSGSSLPAFRYPSMPRRSGGSSLSQVVISNRACRWIIRSNWP